MSTDCDSTLKNEKKKWNSVSIFVEWANLHGILNGAKSVVCIFYGCFDLTVEKKRKMCAYALKNRNKSAIQANNISRLYYLCGLLVHLALFCC